jgi:hypothetical protein
VEVPEDAEITGIEMTAGFTKAPRGDRDLFTMNHRVARVRVLRGRSVIAEQALDVDNRELQTIALTESGGKLRIELAELTPGSNTEWQEACVSEIRVMGRSPSASEGSSTPEVELGPIGGYDINDAISNLRELQAAPEGDSESRGEGPVLRAEYDYNRAWAREILATCNMPRLEEGWEGVSRRWRRVVTQYANLERSVGHLQERVDSGEASDRDRARLERLSERKDTTRDVVDRVQEQADGIIEQINEFMCDEGSELDHMLAQP